MFKFTRYLGGNRYESQCVKCRETVQWSQGDNVGMVYFQDQDIGVLCSKCYNWTKGGHARHPSKCATG